MATIETKDCTGIEDITPQKYALLAEIQQYTPHPINGTDREAEPLVYYNENDKRWWAGRYIGQAQFSKGSISIMPRFTNEVLGRLLGLSEDAVKEISNKNKEKEDDKKFKHWLYLIIALIWEHKLSQANVYGLPRMKQDVIRQDSTMRGRLLVRPTIFTWVKNKEVVSCQTNKVPNTVIASILMGAYELLKHHTPKDQLLRSPAARDAFLQFAPYACAKYISFKQYCSIKYNALDLAWRPIVDFSWSILQQEYPSLAYEQADSGDAVFFRYGGNLGRVFV